MNTKSILFTGGGTAGHVIVNLALIPYFTEQGWKIHYIGSKKGIERDLIESMPNVTYHAISTGKLRRYMSLENAKDPFRVLKGIWDAWNIMRKTKPSIVFSKGGFVSVPVVVAARFRAIPTIIHESDLTPGLANKLATPFAKKIVTTFPETMSFLPAKKSEHVGAVIRQELFQGKKSKGYSLLHGASAKPVLLIMGGSIGSKKINEAVRENLATFLQEYQIIHICGRDNVEEELQQPGYTQFEYVNEELKDLFAITDLVISRAGANAIFEFLALNLPMLLIPLSLEASRGDQIDNAKSFKEQGFAHVLFEEELTAEQLLQHVDKLSTEASMMKERLAEDSSEASRKRAIQIIEEMAKK